MPDISVDDLDIGTEIQVHIKNGAVVRTYIDATGTQIISATVLDLTALDENFRRKYLIGWKKMPVGIIKALVDDDKSTTQEEYKYTYFKWLDHEWITALSKKVQSPNCKCSGCLLQAPHIRVVDTEFICISCKEILKLGFNNLKPSQ